MQNHIETAIKSAVKERGQPADLAKKLTAWMQALSVGNDNIDDIQRAMQRVSIIFETTTTDTKGR